MNRIKHFMILALALAMSLGAWAQQEVLLTTVTATGETSYSQSPDGIVTVTLNIGFYDDYDYGWLGGTVTVEANQGYTITRCVFKQNTVSIADDLAPFTATLSGYSTDNVSVETSTGHVNGDADHMIGITSIEVYGHQADPSPTVTHNADGSWSFTMPDYDAALNVTYYLQPNLAWTYNSAAMPAEGLTAYRGFELPVIGGIGASMDHDFLTALQGGTVSLRYGSVNGVVTFTDPNDRQSFTVTGSGLDTVYMVFDGNDDYQYDSAFFAVNILDPATLTLAKEGNGTVSALLGGDDVWNYETWANLSTTGSEHSFTVGDITLSHTGNEYEGFYQLTTSGNPLRILSSSGTLTFTSNGAPFTRIQLLMVNEYSSSNPQIQPLDGWSFDGRYATWEGNAQSVSMTQCTTKVDQIVFTRGSNSIVVTATEGQYLVIPGAEVQVVATAKDGNHVSAWSDNRQPQHYTSDTNTITVGESMTLTATFAQNPLLTLEANGYGTVSLDGDSIGTVYTFTFEHSGNSEDDRAITIPANRLPYDTTFSYNANITFADAYDQMGEGVSMITHGDDHHTVTVRISGAFEYGGYYSCELEGGDRDDWTISCTTGTGPVTPNGITKTGDNTYRVLPGTQLSVTATPDAAHYLARIDGHDTVGNHACGYSFVMPSSDKNLAATFTTKPTLTLTQTAGGTLEAIVGNTLAITEIPSSIAEEWAIDNVYLGPSDMPGFESIPEEDAMAWTGVPSEGIAKLLYRYDAGEIYMCVWENGVYSGTDVLYSEKPEYAQMLNMDQRLFYTTGGGAGNVIASSTPNTYIIDYGTPVTVVATPDAQHYLKNFEGFADTNSNVAVKKTFDSVIADIPNLSANFQAKPTLTLTANDGGTLTLDGITTELDQMMAHLSDPIAPGTQFSAFLQSDGVLKDNVKTLTDAQAIALAQRIAQTTGNNNILVVASTFEFIGDKYLSYGKPDGNNEGGTATMTNSNTIYTIYYVNTFDLLPESYPTGVAAGTTANTYRVDYGTTVTVTATPDATHYLATLGGVTMGSNTAKDTTFALTATTNLEATFAPKPVLTLAVNNSEWGSVAPVLAGTTYTGTVDVTVLKPGDIIKDVTELTGYVNAVSLQQGRYKMDGSLISSDAGLSVSQISFNDNGYSIRTPWQATYTPVTENGENGNAWIVLEIGTNGPVIGGTTVSGTAPTAEPAADIIASETEGQYYVMPGTQVVAKATPERYRHLAGWSNNYGVNETLTDTVTVTADMTLTAIFEKDSPALVWMYGKQLMPEGGVTVYKGFEADTIAKIAINGSNDFMGIYSKDESILSFGSTDTNIVSIDANGHPVVKTTGTVTIYMIHDGSFFATDTARYTFTVLQPAVLTLAVNDTAMGSVVLDNVGGAGLTEITTPDPSWQNNYSEPASASALPGFKPMTLEEAQALGAPATSGEARVIYSIDEVYNYFNILYYFNGEFFASESDVRYGMIYDFVGPQSRFFYTSGAGSDSIIATEQENVFHVVPGATVKAVATPNEAYYFVNWDNEAAVNSNTGDTNTLTMVTDNMTLTANFAAKPTITLAQNEADWGKVEIPIGLVATDPTPAPTPTAVANPVITGVLMPDGSMQVTMSCTTQDADIYYTTDNVTSPTCDCPAAPEYTQPITFTEPVTIKAAVYTGNDWSAVVTKTITLSLPAGVAQLTDTTYRVDYGTTLTLQADATELHHVQAWLDQNADTLAAAQYDNYFVTEPENLFPKNSTLTFTMTQDTVATAMFGINSYDVTAMMAASQAERGTVKALYTDILGEAQSAINDTVEITAQGGSTTTLVAIPANTCFDFAYWQVGSEQIEKDTLTVTAATQAVAYFVYHQYTGDTTVDVCDRYTWHGLIYSTVPEVAPTYIYKTAQDECDSTVTLHLTLRYATTGDTTASECDQFSWFEHTGLTASTEELQHVFVNAVGCDSTVTLHLTIRYSNTGVETATACDQYEWQGTVYTESNTTDQRVLTNAANCDSTVTLNLTVNYHHDSTVHYQTSGDFVWGRGTTYQETFTENGTYNRTIDTKQGCDSNVTIVLAYLPHTTPLPTIYNIMGVSLFINHFPEGTDKIDYIYYRWYKNGEIVSEGEDKDSYSEDGDMLNGCFYLEISTEPTLTYWAQSNEVCLGNVGIDDVKDITMTLAPNPVVRGQQVTVTVSESNLQGAVATVYDAQGRQVSNFEVRNSTFEIQTSNLTAGIYTVRIVLSDGRMATKKVVVK